MTCRRAQRGVVALVLMLVLVASVAGLSVAYLSAYFGQNRQDQLNSQVLAAARDALAGEFTRRQRSAAGPYGLPCPDTDGNGLSNAPCSTPAQSIGRLPWVTLGIGELRDASGAPLWYAVSPTWGDAAARPGTTTAAGLQVSAPDNTVLHGNGTTTGAAVAIIFAPGGPLVRMGSALPQTRSTTVATDYLDRCAPALCTITQDNADADSQFVASTAGALSDGTGQVRFNDQARVLTRGELCNDRRTGGGANAC